MNRGNFYRLYLSFHVRISQRESPRPENQEINVATAAKIIKFIVALLFSFCIFILLIGLRTEIEVSKTESENGGIAAPEG